MFTLVVVASLCMAAIAIAASPKDGVYTGKDVSVTVKGKKVTNVSGGFGYKCGAIPIQLKKKLAVKRGKFHFSGKVKNLTGDDAGKLTLSGKFVTKEKVTGKYKLVRGTCVSKKKYTAKFAEGG
jgi:hypothetical protein